MSREFSVRVSEELADWVRRQGPPSRVIGNIASAAHRGKLRADVLDPGPGPDRLTVRVPEPALPRIRELTHSRDSLVALRKLVLAGFEAKALPVHSPAFSSPALPVTRVINSENPMNHAYGEPPENHLWREENFSPTGSVNLLPLVGSYSLVSHLMPSPGPSIEKRSAGFLTRLLDHPMTAYILFLGLPVLAVLLLYFFRKRSSVVTVNPAPASASLPKDFVWSPESASRLAELVW